MTSTTQRYRAAASQSASTAEKIADFWTQGSQRLSDYMLPGLPQVGLVPVVDADERHRSGPHQPGPQRLQPGLLSLAGGAPRGPEVHHHDLPRIIARPHHVSGERPARYGRHRTGDPDELDACQRIGRAGGTGGRGNSHRQRRSDGEPSTHFGASLPLALHEDGGAGL